MRILGIAGTVAAAFFMMGVAAAGEAEIGFRQEWQAPEGALKEYSQLYIHTVDLRDMKTSRIDRDGDRYEQSVDEEVLRRIAFIIYEEFSNIIKGVIPVFDLEGQVGNVTELKGKGLLVLEVKLSYDLTVEDQGLLMGFFTGKDSLQHSPGEVSIQCLLRDADSGKPLLTLTDSQELPVFDTQDPFGDEKDQAALQELIAIWAQRVVNILQLKRT